MLLDRALTLAFRNFAACFLLAASLVLPLHVAVSYLQRETIALRQIHNDITRLPDDTRVRGVGPAEVATYRASGTLLLAIEIVALPVLVAGSAHIVQRDQEGELGSVHEAWLAGLTGWRQLRPRHATVLAGGAALGIAVTLLARTALLLLADPLPQALAWLGPALAEGVSRALGAPFLLVPAAVAADTRLAKGETGGAPN